MLHLVHAEALEVGVGRPCVARVTRIISATTLSAASRSDSATLGSRTGAATMTLGAPPARADPDCGEHVARPDDDIEVGGLNWASEKSVVAIGMALADHLLQAVIENIVLSSTPSELRGGQHQRLW